VANQFAQVDDDTFQAVIAAWKADKTLSGIVPAPPQQGRLKEPQGFPPNPYAQITCKLDKRERADTKGVWWDWRHVEIVVRGLYADVVKSMTAARTVFHHSTDNQQPPDTILVYPSGAPWKAWVPDNDTTTEQEENQKNGLDVWKGTLSALACSLRTK